MRPTQAGWDGTSPRGPDPSLQEGAQASGRLRHDPRFATNVSNYTHLYNRDGMAMESSDPCYNEMVYVKKLAVG